MFDFDRVIERRNTHAAKWDNIARLSGIEAPDAIAMWVADMTGWRAATACRWIPAG